MSGSDDFVVPIMRIALYTGLRLGDVVSLKWENVDFKNGFITKKMEKTDKTVVDPVLDYDYMQPYIPPGNQMSTFCHNK